VGHLKELKIPKHSPRRVGIVESDARDKTRKVSIRFSVRHPKYGKYIRRRTLLQVHDEDNVSKVGDRVEVAECRPVSKSKSWVVLKAAGAAATPVTAETETVTEEWQEK
jgi:small subunit ribosomal protein S17